ncbi:SDR family NAD(P)-dependent oxidoreductase [Qipengyuania soli]|uniref:SDR family NAD(P)-dependent oxidoreductase n=1 Tax=Qipengyuania soli TaxID=2782568 RepID=A0A7S8F700_9SPHN|nr:SDR family NAD(P)-dependent oxidoreductase [Qipengyuania soli]QPD00169.1 SDR family NAD(P)-dependent oxidoreductase [Qipengyuania soli]
MTKRLEGRLALVTGASKGIGAATAKALAAEGVHVVLTGRDVRALEAVEDEIHEAGGNSTIAPVDLAEPDGIARLASALSGRWDKLDYLVISAAYLPTLTSVTQIDGKQLSQAVTINVLATQSLLANFDPLLKRADGARVIGLTSSVGAAPRAYWAAYGSTKAAFDNILESYAAEIEKISKVRVAVIDPGATRTAMRAKAYPGEDPQTVKPPEAVANRIVELLVNDFTGFHRERVEG